MYIFLGFLVWVVLFVYLSNIYLVGKLCVFDIKFNYLVCFFFCFYYNNLMFYYVLIYNIIYFLKKLLVVYFNI